ncbi:MAG: hypothetical protein KJ792_03080, partial [Actinobacteria bacterium]|nr:hypothetical protein [Actinomycetota bacterium]MCG2801985.1 hypothetical protein [Cellulomonas sp.]
MTLVDDADRGVDAAERGRTGTDGVDVNGLDPDVVVPDELPDSVDRRGTAAGPRLSWARSRPYEDRPPRQVERLDAGWQVESGAYVL